MSQVIFVADLFADQHLGGAEINDNTLIQWLKDSGYYYDRMNSSLLTKDYILSNKDKIFIFGNFAQMNMHLAPYFALTKYIVYEHDYKFLASRNPISYKNFIAPKNMTINHNFYENAKAVVCLSKMHREIFDKNIELNNIRHINCSLFDDDKIALLQSLYSESKPKGYAIMKTNNPTKKMPQAIAWCKSKGLEYDLISHKDNNEFLKIMSQYQNLVFMTGHPEPTPRIAVEAKLMGVNLIANKKLIGVANEYWWDWEPPKIAKELVNIRKGAFKMFEELFDG